MSSDSQREAQEKETGRIEAFSDGVFAIAITLLILDVKVPLLEEAEKAGLWTVLLERAPNFLAFVVSFFFILVMWINHHRLFTVIRRSDNNLLLLNGLLLFGVTFVPFPAALVAEYLNQPDQIVALMVYNFWFFLIAIFFNAMWWYASSQKRLFSAKTDYALVKHISRQYMGGPFLYFVALILAFIHPYLSLLASFLLAVYFVIPNPSVQQLMDTQNEE